MIGEDVKGRNSFLIEGNVLAFADGEFLHQLRIYRLDYYLTF
jgi:hypothetical protein